VLKGKKGARGGRTPEFSLAHGLLGFGRNLLDDADDFVWGSPDSSGAIYGTGKYESLDAGWLEALLVWIETGTRRAAFGPTPATVTIPNDASVAIIGDWGTGDFGSKGSPSGSALIGQYISQTLKPEITIHLGDVYYTGIDDNERDKLVEIFPAGSLGSYTLNSNHEMYPGATGYFGVALANSIFAAQRNTSYFCLQNDDWAIVGLDSAYYADYWDLYLSGTLVEPNGESEQLAFLTQIAQSGRQLIVLTHHNPLSLAGQPNDLWSQVVGALTNTPSASKPVTWYYGHAHNGAVYLDVPGQKGSPTVRPRLSGHAAVPYTVATDLTGSDQVSWLEKTYVSGDSGPVRNGFSTLTFNGSKLTEQMLDQLGEVSWPTIG